MPRSVTPWRCRWGRSAAASTAAAPCCERPSSYERLGGPSGGGPVPPSRPLGRAPPLPATPRRGGERNRPPADAAGMSGSGAHLDDRLSALADGELSPADEAQARVHLAECGACRAELSAVEESRAWVRA